MTPSPSRHSGNRLGHRWAFLVNPVSGTGTGTDLRGQLVTALERSGLPADAWTCGFTEAGAGLIRQVAELAASHDRIVVAGGDGTIGLSLQGLSRSGQTDCALGVIPLGTGNDLARELHLFEDFRDGGLESLLQAFLLDRTAPLDLWSINGGQATMINYLSLGLDGKATEMFATRRVLGGRKSILANKLRFAQAGIAALFQRLPSDFRMRLHRDGQVEDLALPRRRTIAILNVSHYAGGLLRIAETRPDDGFLTITCLPSMWAYAGLVLRRLCTRGRVGSGQLPLWRADRIECTWTGDVGLQIDGEGREDLRECGRLDLALAGRVKVLVGSPPEAP